MSSLIMSHPLRSGSCRTRCFQVVVVTHSQVAILFTEKLLLMIRSPYRFRRLLECSAHVQCSQRTDAMRSMVYFTQPLVTSHRTQMRSMVYVYFTAARSHVTSRTAVHRIQHCVPQHSGIVGATGYGYEDDQGRDVKQGCFRCGRTEHIRVGWCSMG